ncbi:MAG: ferrous iron transport protein B [Oscillospiraceae bacterium]|jgi:ferrous iron transport protein B|nr:ferrous iron transport protein B [Oscillospiraceae bacterium]
MDLYYLGFINPWRKSVNNKERKRIKIINFIKNNTLGIEPANFNGAMFQSLKKESNNKFKHVQVNHFNKEKLLRIALIGNPNTGKTTLFNRLTGSSQCVGNWPGVTVERKEGIVRAGGLQAKIIDLPGVYSLSPYSPEEIITRNFLLGSQADLILNIVDATNLERNLYLTTQLMETDIPLVIALNMADLLNYKGKIVDYCQLENELGLPVVSISAGKNAGINSLLERISDFENEDIKKNLKFYNSNIERKINKINEILKDFKKEFNNKRFIIIKILENDEYILRSLGLNFEILKRIQAIRDSSELMLLQDEIINSRHRFVGGIVRKTVQSTKKLKEISISRKIDKMVTGKYTAIPIFLGIVMLIFYITFGPIGSFFEKSTRSLIEDGINHAARVLLSQFNAGKTLSSLVEAVVSGLGEVISFLPQMMILFGFLAALEDSGYMVRAAFVMDKLLRKIGLSGRAFVPLLMGFGCSVPAIMSTRILENKREKNLSILLIPFMSCGAKMPVYLLFMNIFFVRNKALIIFLIYISGIIFSILTAVIFKKIILRGSRAPFIMELPDYKIPSLRNIYIQIWENLKDFLERAGTIILGSTVVIWFLQCVDLTLKFTSNSSKSLIAVIGSIISPIFLPCGFGNWKAAVALITGMISKESIVSTLAVVFSNSDIDLKTALNLTFTPASSISFIIFVLLYSPCMAAVSAVRKELKSTSKTLLVMGYCTGLAWIASTITYQILKLILVG